LHPARAAGSPFRKESVLGLPGGVRALLPVQLVGAPGADRPSHGLGRHPGQHQTRTPHNVRSGMATIPGQEKLPGGSLETPPSIKSVGRPPIVTAARSQSVRRYPRWGIAPEQGGTRTRNQASEAESPNLSRQIGLSRPSKPTHQMRAVAVGSRLGCWRSLCSHVVAHRCSGSVRAAEVLGGPPGMHPARILGQGRPQHLPQAHNRQQRTGHRRRDRWRLPIVKGSPTRSWWSARHRSSSARWW
jgi:hypothetical protein